MPLARRTVHKRWLRKPLLLSYMLYSEWMVTEQNRLYNKARGIRRFKKWAPIDFTARVATKGFIRVAGALGAKVVQRLSTRLQMGDERVVAHVD
jgi:hypothetical protein